MWPYRPLRAEPGDTPPRRRRSRPLRNPGAPGEPLSSEGRAYLLGRGLTPGEIEQVGAFTPWKKPEYVAFPLPDGYHARRIVEGTPRWITSPGAKGPWGIDAVVPACVVYVTEGIFDAIMLRRMGRIAVAAMGPRPTQADLRQVLLRQPRMVVLVPDADVPPGATAEAVASVLKLDRRVCVTVLRPPEGVKDFGELLLDASGQGG